MRRAGLLGLVLVLCGAGQLTAQEITPTLHHVFSGPAHCDEPQRIVIKLPPPKVEYRDKDCSDTHDGRRRFCLFGHCNKERLHHRAPLGEALYAPVNLPSMVLQAPSQTSSFTQQITHDFGALRQAQELDLRAAGLAAQLAARDAMRSAEDEWIQDMLDRSEGKLKALGGALKASQAGALKAADATSLNEALKQINDRLNRLEELVLQHHQAIDALRKQQPAKDAK
ncbi:MAG: hypothetical protein L0215_21545 [Gemmataceae bacterium]|nr:hypothetical protein [Gemmataceae bacterium]